MKHYLLNILSMVNVNNQLKPRFTYIVVGDDCIEEFRNKYKNHRYKTLYSEIELSEQTINWFSLADYNNYVKECNAVKHHTLKSMKLCIPQTFDRILQAHFQADCLNDLELGNLIEAYARLGDKNTHHAKQVGEKINKRLQQLWEEYQNVPK